jgi:hypothetical protein
LLITVVKAIRLREAVWLSETCTVLGICWVCGGKPQSRTDAEQVRPRGIAQIDAKRAGAGFRRELGFSLAHFTSICCSIRLLGLLATILLMLLDFGFARSFFEQSPRLATTGLGVAVP